ncbi:MAG: glucosamine-6-phosphate deaminase [Acidobacteria bacterium]|nr:glucosamine-6-phosphate deaminase [Acidobacteriota bacterium]
MNIIIKRSEREVSRAAADHTAALIREKPDAVLGLATGATPLGTYRELIRMHGKGLDFSRIVTFNLDEYIGYGMDLSRPYSKDQSYARFMHEELFRHINIHRSNIHIPNGLADDPKEECRRYERRIRDAGGIDLQLLGIGRTGHWAFNEPGTPLDSRTHIQILSKKTLDDNFRLFFHRSGLEREMMPTRSITMGVGTILEARSLLMIATGKRKASITAAALEGEITSSLTASAVQLFKGPATVLLDRGAAFALQKR